MEFYFFILNFPLGGERVNKARKLALLVKYINSQNRIFERNIKRAIGIMCMKYILIKNSIK